MIGSVVAMLALVTAAPTLAGATTFALTPNASRNNGCYEGYVPIDSWQSCTSAAISLGYTGDSVVVFQKPWGDRRPRGCFRSTENNQFHFNCGAGASYKTVCRVRPAPIPAPPTPAATATTSAAPTFALTPGGSCEEGSDPITEDWESCMFAAMSLGYTGDSVGHVDYEFAWGDDRPRGCFRSTETDRFHFNPGVGGSYKILCRLDGPTTANSVPTPPSTLCRWRTKYEGLHGIG